MDWISQHQAASWLIAALLLAAAEMLVGELVMLMLAVGCFAGGMAALASAGMPVQVVVTAAVAAAMLGLVRPSVLARLHRGPELVTGPARLVGTRGVVTAVAQPGGVPGQARIGGETWSIVPEPGTEDPVLDAAVEVVAIRGASAVVRSVSGGDRYVTDSFEPRE